MYKYETHLHTYPVSRCASAGVRETLEYYASLGYDGVFITNHFVGANINIDHSAPYEEQIEFFFSDYEAGVEIGLELGLSVFCGLEMTYKGTDFLVYGLDKQWFLSHPEVMKMKMSERLLYMADAGALVVHAHPFYEASYIDHVRLFPHCVHGVEVNNTSRNAFHNGMAKQYAKNYGLIEFAGSDNHCGPLKKKLGGVESRARIKNERQFIERALARKLKPFVIELD